MIVNRAQAAEILGVSLPTLDKFVRTPGFPTQGIGGKGVAWELDAGAIVKWLVSRERAKILNSEKAPPTDLEEAKLRKLAAEAELAELEIAKKRGEVAPVAEIERLAAKAFATVRAGMRNIPNRAVSRIIGETDERTLKSVLLEEIDQALTILATETLLSPENDELTDDDDV